MNRLQPYTNIGMFQCFNKTDVNCSFVYFLGLKLGTSYLSPIRPFEVLRLVPNTSCMYLHAKCDYCHIWHECFMVVSL